MQNISLLYRILPLERSYEQFNKLRKYKMTMLNTSTIAAADIKILAVLDADGETAVAEFKSNGAFFKDSIE